MIGRVTRRSPADRLTALAAAATESFGKVGYRRTRTDQVATAAGMSAGAVFNFVDSKEALFHLVFLVGFGALEGTPALPIHVDGFDETIDLVARGLRRAAAAPRLREAARAADAPDDVTAELAEIVTEMFTMTTTIWPLLAVIERSASDLPALEEFYFGRGRPQRRKELEQYVARRVAGGHFRASVDSPIAARWMLESITWFAWHRREDRDAELYDDDRALAGLMTLISDALLEPHS
jgi:AcrR family transcriptional regulator